MKKTILFLLFCRICFGQVSRGQVLHFPQNRSVGVVHAWDAGAEYEQDVHLRFFWPGRFYSRAKGDVIVRSGKRCGVKMTYASEQNLSAICQAGDIAYLSITDKRLKGSRLARLADMKGLKLLNLEYAKLGDRDLKYVNEIKSVEILALPKNITDAGLKELNGLKSLKTLYLSGDSVTDEGLAELAGTVPLKNICIRIPFQGQLDFLSKIGRLPNLRYHIQINPRAYTGAVARYLRGANSLVWLNVGDCPVKGKELAVFSRIPELEDLSLYGVDTIFDNDMACLQNMKSLKKLNIGDRLRNTKLTDRSMEYVGKLAQLEELRLPSSITDKGLAKLTGLGNLKDLTLWNTIAVSDEGVGHISKMSKLKVLSLYGHNRRNKNDCILTDKAMEHLSKLRELEELRIRNSEVTDAGFAHLKKLKSLKSLSVATSGIHTSVINSVVKELPELTQLSVTFAPDSSALDVSCLSKLKSLQLHTQADSGVAVRDKDLICLQGLTNLEGLFITNMRKEYKRDIGDYGMKNLKDLSELRLLYIGGPGMTDKGLSYLTGMRHMQDLCVEGNFTEAGFKYLEDFEKLEYLQIYTDNSISKVALMELKKKFPRLIRFLYGKDVKHSIDLVAKEKNAMLR